MPRLVLLSLAALALLPASAQAVPTWAPEAQATIHPGVQTYTDGAQCTANFVFTNAAGDVLIGQAAHCSGTGASTETNGCEAESLPNGTPVEIDGASRPGIMVYNSWNAMQRAGESDPETCQYNDFALVEIDRADHAKVNPTVPYWGGPMSLTTSSEAGEKVYSYGNSGLRGGVRELSPKEGQSLGTTEDGWTTDVYTVTPGIPGDSGSGFLDDQGRAFGVLSTVALAPLPASNGVSTLSLAMQYAYAEFGTIRLAIGTRPFVDRTSFP